MLRLGGIVDNNELVRASISSLSIPSLRERKLMEEIQRQQLGRRLAADPLDASQFEGIVGNSPLMGDVFAALRQNPTEWLINRVGNGPGVSLHCAV